MPVWSFDQEFDVVDRGAVAGVTAGEVRMKGWPAATAPITFTAELVRHATQLGLVQELDCGDERAPCLPAGCATTMVPFGPV